MMQKIRLILAVSAPALSLSLLAACGGGSAGPSDPGPVVTPTPAPTPAPTPTPGQPAACRLSAPTVDCATRPAGPQALAADLQAAVDVATTTAGAMYPGENRIYDLDLFRKRVVDDLAARNMCGAWDYGNEKGDEIFVRSADGCVVEQYDLIAGDGGVRNANKGSNAWQAGWGTPVPDPKPDFPRYGDLTCSLPGDRATFCFSIKNTPGAYGAELYQAMVEVLNENPQLFDKGEISGGGNPDFAPDRLVLPSWRIANQDGYIAAVERKIRAKGFCGYVYQGDILLAKKVSAGNRIHEEVDIVLNPPSGVSYVSFIIKDRCHNAGF
jgi:hypothetical protein